MVSVIILILILLCLVINRYLNYFWEDIKLPYPRSFTIFATLFAAIYLINYVWLFGFLVGIIVFILTFFQIIFSSYLWPFLLPIVRNIYKKPSTLLLLAPPEVNPFIYGISSFIIIALGGLTILNFFISDYGCLLIKIEELLNNNYKIPVILLAGSMILGNLIRIYVMKRMSDSIDDSA